MDKKLAVCYVSIAIAIFLIGCNHKSNEVKPTGSKLEIEKREERKDSPESKEEAIYHPSGFHYDNTLKTTNAEDEYNDRLDDYLDDPEDELRFDPEIFDFQDE